MGGRGRLLLMFLAVAAACIAVTSPAGVEAQVEGSLEYDGADRQMTLRLGRTTIERKRSGSSSVYSHCVFSVGSPSDVDGFLHREVVGEVDVDDGWREIAFITQAEGTWAGGYCPDGTSFRNGLPYTAWRIDVVTDDIRTEMWTLYEEAVATMPFPDPTIVSAPKATTPFLLNLPVGLKPSAGIVPVAGSVGLGGGAAPALTMDVVATPNRITFAAADTSVECAAPFPSDAELITDPEPACSLTFDDAEPGNYQLSMRIEYVVAIACRPVACGWAPSILPVIDVVIPVELTEAIGLR